MNEIYFTPESKGKSINSKGDYLSDFIQVVGSIIKQSYNNTEKIIKNIIEIPSPNTMKVEFECNENTIQIELNKVDRWVYKFSWSGNIKVNDTILSFPIYREDREKLDSILFTPLERVEQLLRGYDYNYEYIDDGRQYQKARDNNNYIIKTVKELNLNKEELSNIIEKSFRSEESINGVKKIFNV